MLGVHAAEDVGLDGGHGLPGLGILRVAYSMHERESGRDSVSLAMQMEMDMDMEKRTNRLAHGSQRRCVFVYLEGGIGGEGRERHVLGLTYIYRNTCGYMLDAA